MELYIVYWRNSWGTPQIRTVHTDPELAKAECQKLWEEDGQGLLFHNWQWRAIKAGETIL